MGTQSVPWRSKTETKLARDRTQDPLQAAQWPSWEASVECTAIIKVSDNKGMDKCNVYLQ